MSFASEQANRSAASEVTLFLFEYGTGSGQQFAYTDRHVETAHLGYTFVPTPITHSTITETGSFDKTDLTVTLPIESEFNAYYRTFMFARSVSLVIYKGNNDDPSMQWVPVWSGVVRGVDEGEAEAVVTLESLRTVLKTLGNRRKYQKRCPHVLYGPECNAMKTPATITTYATTNRANRNLLLPAGWNPVHHASKYVGGIAEWTNERGVEYRAIVAASGNSITLSGSTRGAELGPVKLSLGCNKTTENCSNLHKDPDFPTGDRGNIRNFGGQPWIPLENPLGIRKNQYF